MGALTLASECLIRKDALLSSNAAMHAFGTYLHVNSRHAHTSKRTLRPPCTYEHPPQRERQPEDAERSAEKRGGAEKDALCLLVAAPDGRGQGSSCCNSDKIWVQGLWGGEGRRRQRSRGERERGDGIGVTEIKDSSSMDAS